MKIDLNRSPKLVEGLLVVVVFSFILFNFMSQIYSPKSLEREKLKLEVEKITSQYDAFVKLESAPKASNIPTQVIPKGKDPFLIKTSKSFLNPPIVKESLVTLFNQKLVSRELLQGINLNKLDLEQEIMENDYSRFAFHLHLEGGYLGLIRYMKETLSEEMLISFDQIKLNVLEGKSGSLDLLLDGTLFVPVPGQKASQKKKESNK